MSLDLLTRALSQPLLLEPVMARDLAYLVIRHNRGELFTGPQIHAEIGMQDVRSRPIPSEGRSIGIIPIVGLIAHRAHSAGTSVQQIDAMLTSALNAKQVEAILLEVDSPGGMVDGVPELAERIYEARRIKPIFASINGLGASAGYWLAASAEEVTVTPSGRAGSIGVYRLHEDWSQALEKDGIKITAMSAGKFKLEGNPWEPLSEEAKTHRLAEVEAVYGDFVKAVARNRNDTTANVRNGYGEGRVSMAKDAKAANLVDGVMTFAEMVNRVARPNVKPRGASGARSRLALDVAKANL